MTKVTPEYLASCYNEANGITIKNPPLTTERIFAAMQYMYELGQKEALTKIIRPEELPRTNWIEP